MHFLFSLYFLNFNFLVIMLCSYNLLVGQKGDLNCCHFQRYYWSICKNCCLDVNMNIFKGLCFVAIPSGLVLERNTTPLFLMLFPYFCCIIRITSLLIDMFSISSPKMVAQNFVVDLNKPRLPGTDMIAQIPLPTFSKCPVLQWISVVR